MKGRTRKRPESYTVRHYRMQSCAPGLQHCQVCYRETDLHIQADGEVSARAQDLVLHCRLQLEEYIAINPSFATSLVPLAQDRAAPPLIQWMMEAGDKAGVGPMAAVAGAIAEMVGSTLLKEGVGEIIVENGGDIFIARQQPARVAIFAGQSPLSGRVGIELPRPMPWGVCTSSGTVGHSLSLGEADSVTVLARSTALADAAATRIGNETGRGRGSKGVERALKVASEIDGVSGVVVICGEVMGAVGEIQLVGIAGEAGR